MPPRGVKRDPYTGRAMTDPDVPSAGPRSEPTKGQRPRPPGDTRRKQSASRSTRPQAKGRATPTVRWWGVLAIVAAGLVAANLFAAAIGPDLPKLAGTDEETLVKEGDIQDQAGGRTDVVALGASETAAGIDPKALDEASSRFTGAYNAAMRGASPATNQQWANRVVGPDLQPKVAVVGLLPWTLAELEGDGADFQDRSDDAYAAAIDEVDPGRLGRVEQALEDHVPLFRYRHELRSPSNVLNGLRTWATGKEANVAPSLDPATIRRNIASSGQSLEYLARPEVQSPDPQLGRELTKVSNGRFDLEPLEDLLRSLQRQGIEPVLALAPTDRATLQASGLDFARIDQVAADAIAIAERLDVPVMDKFRGVYGTDQFHDKEHLNQQGAQRWSRELGAWLDELCDTGTLGDDCGPTG